MTRLFNATPDRVFRAWTDPEQLKKWFAPRPFTVPEAEVDLRPGGVSRIVMRDPDGNDYPNTGVYLEVVENERLVSTDAYVKMGFHEGWGQCADQLAELLESEDASQD